MAMTYQATFGWSEVGAPGVEAFEVATAAAANAFRLFVGFGLWRVGVGWA